MRVGVRFISSFDKYGFHSLATQPSKPDGEGILRRGLLFTRAKR